MPAYNLENRLLPALIGSDGTIFYKPNEPSGVEEFSNVRHAA